MWKDTGPGVVDEDKTGGPEPLRAKLANFNIDGDEVKPAHVEFLLKQVVPRLEGKKGSIWMRGHASQTGRDEHNKNLSRHRVENVAKILRDVGITANQMQLEAVGEGMSVGSKKEDASDRAVVLVVWPRNEDDPPPPPQAPPPPKTNLRFQIRQNMNVNLGVVVAADFSIFQIWDLENALTSFYTYMAVGAGSGPLPVSGTAPGSWNDFSVNKAVSVSAFGGPARFTTVGGGNLSVNFLGIMGLPAGFRTIPSPLTLSTGFTLVGGAGGSVGALTLQKLGTRTGRLPFAGP